MKALFTIWHQRLVSTSLFAKDGKFMTNELCGLVVNTLCAINAHVVALCQAQLVGWWRGVVGNAFRLKRSYSTPGPVSTAMGDCLRAGKPSQCEACQLGRLSLLPSVGR